MNHDGVLAVGGCDKNMPGCLMAMARLNVPTIFVYGGSILPGTGDEGEDLDIVSIFEAVGQFPGRQARRRRASTRSRCDACPGAGSCGGMYTANTMSSAIEAMGMSLPYSLEPGRLRRQGARDLPAGKVLVRLIEKDIRPRDIITRKSLENAYTVSWRWAARPTRSCT